MFISILHRHSLIARSFTSYTAGVMIAYSAVQKAIHDQPFAMDLELLNKCIKVLAYCALNDPMAGRFRDLLNHQFTDLQEHSVSLLATTELDHPMNKTKFADTLFTFDPTSKLHAASQRLLNLIQRPFSGLGDIPEHATLSNRAETGVGAHLEWQWELKDGNDVNEMVEPKEVCAGACASVEDAMAGQLGGGAWSTWTPAVGFEV